MKTSEKHFSVAVRL